MKAGGKNIDLPLETLYVGDQGPMVIQLQGKLHELGLYNGRLTGQFDNRTQQALIAFQDQYGVIETGFMGPKTWYALTFWSQETDIQLFPEALKQFFYRVRYTVSTYADKLTLLAK
ncbi:peptidoglycan-binding domain-containing protein [Leptothoe sp. LEGE 181152]|nr:peptidoglycan-binding domain-containing protein [Leptothoe sp. LEGE 181152]